MKARWRLGRPSATIFGCVATLVLGLTPGFAPSARAAASVPKLDHVFIIVLENENLAATWYTPNTYLNGLLAQGTFASQYYATSHVSADNYMAMTSGQTPTPLFNADCPDWSKCRDFEAGRPDGGVSIADQVEGTHKSWKAYMDGTPKGSTPGPCMHPAPDPSTASFTSDPYQSGYATRHDPFVYYPPIVDNQARCDAHVVPYSQLASDLVSASTTPNYVFITPDTCHDGHDSPCTGTDIGQPGWQQGGLVSANAWMSTEVPKILSSPAFTTPGTASVLLVTTDEAANTDVTGCSTGPITSAQAPGTCSSGVPAVGVNGGGLVGLLAIGSTSLVPRGKTTATPFDHNSLLRTVEDGLQLGSINPPPGAALVFQDGAGHLNNAGSPLEHPMSDLFN